MSDPDTTPVATTTETELAYAGASRLTQLDTENAQFSLFGNIKRAPVSYTANLRDPLRLREALLTLYKIVGSDFRYVPKDRTAYIAFQRMRRESAKQGAWQAQQAYFDWLYRNDPDAWLILDPIISVHPDEVAFEIFSKDEGMYAKLSVKPEAFDKVNQKSQKYGTTNIDFSQSLHDHINQFRSYRTTRFSINQQDTSIDTESARADSVLEKQIKIPDSWIRSFLQVQSAATLPMESFHLAPIDVYNVLYELRMNADIKGKRRGLRVELVPGESTAGIYEGCQAKVVRLWGRRRLMLLKPFLALAESVEIKVLGSGLPCFWILRGKDLELTVGLTGFTVANWSQAACFDLLLPRSTEASKDLKTIIETLSGSWFASHANLAKSTGIAGPDLTQALQLGCQQGQLVYDIANDLFRLRPLIQQPLDLEKLQYRNKRERQAHDLLLRKNAITISGENYIHGSGLEVTGKVEVKEDKRDYRPQLLINEDGYVAKADCTCNLFRQQGLKEGPCTHLIALRLAHAKRDNERKASGKSRNTITMETRSYSKRTTKGEQVYQLSLDRKRVRVRWGMTSNDLRVQQLQFNSVDAARSDYLKRLDDLVAKGYLDATAG